jgi:hypothetical protein
MHRGTPQILRLISLERAFSAAEPRPLRELSLGLPGLYRRCFHIQLCRRVQPRLKSEEYFHANHSLAVFALRVLPSDRYREPTLCASSPSRHMFTPLSDCVLRCHVSTISFGKLG